MGTVKFVGRTDIAPGIWVGLEMKKKIGKTQFSSIQRVKPAKMFAGKHNGIVNGRRYFSCKDGHGVIVKPKSISVHGINGTDLIRPESHYPV